LPETHRLVFDGRAVTGTDTLDLAGIDRGELQIVLDDPVTGFRRPGDMAGHLGRGDLLRQEGKGHRRLVARLNLERRPADAVPGEPGRRTGLKAAKPEAEPVE